MQLVMLCNVDLIAPLVASWCYFHVESESLYF
jgi:hypothetical protein